MILENKKIILTGAGRGIGKVIAETCAKEGATLCLVSRTEQELKDALNTILSLSPDSFYYVADISSEEDAKLAVNSTIEKLGGIDVLINNAGIQPPIGPFIGNVISSWKTNLDINLFGMINMTHHVLTNMVEEKKGKIINMSGGGSTSPRPNFSAYSVSKTAIVRFTENLAAELKEHNIDVNSVSPGAINTKMLEEIILAKELSGNEYQQALKRKNSGGGDVYLAAKLVSFLSSELSNGITGKLISAQWDPWELESFQRILKSDKDIATLRRIDNKNYYKKV